MAAAQLDPASGPLLAYAGTFLLAAGFYALTAHIAARYVLGDVPIARAALVGVPLAAVAVLLQRYGPAVVIAVSLLVDLLVIQTIYRLRYRTAGLVAIVHYAVSAILGITLYNLARLLGTMP